MDCSGAEQRKKRPMDTVLDDVWTLYFHDSENADWTHPSYVRLVDVSSLEDVASMRYGLRNRVAGGMFFLMREFVFPSWDDPNNIDGGCLTMRVSKQSAEQVWNELTTSAVGDTLHESSQDLIMGISISPKTVYTIIKVWVSRETDPSELNLTKELNGTSLGDVMYKANRDYISANNKALGTLGAVGR